MTDRLPLVLDEPAEASSYFIATYPPFSVWTPAGGAAHTINELVLPDGRRP